MSCFFFLIIDFDDFTSMQIGLTLMVLMIITLLLKIKKVIKS